MIVGKGLLWTPAELQAARLDAATHPQIGAAVSAGEIGGADLSSDLPDVFNQGQTSGCWAHALAAILYAALKRLGRPRVPSPLHFMQTNYARLRGAVYTDGKNMPGLLDNGAQLGDAAESAARLGWRPFGTPQQGGGTDAPATIGHDGKLIPLPELTGLEVSQGLEDVFGGEYEIKPGTGAADLVAASLDAGIFVWDGFQTDETFDNLVPGQVLGVPSGPSKGGHSTLYYGYYYEPGGRRVFRKRNSWGPVWCDRGNYLVDDSHVAKAWALWPCPLKEAS